MDFVRLRSSPDHRMAHPQFDRPLVVSIPAFACFFFVRASTTTVDTVGAQVPSKSFFCFKHCAIPGATVLLAEVELVKMLTLLVLIQHVTTQLYSKAEECAAVAATSVVTAVSDSRCE